MPEVVGVNVTFTVQFAPAATVELQLFVSAKFALALIPEMVNVAVPVLVSVRESGWLVVPTIWSPKLRVFGEKETFGDVWVVPVPLRETVCGLPDALSVTESVPLRMPEVVGLNVTFTVQFAPAATVELQLIVSAKFALALIPEMVNVAVPELVSVTESGWLVAPTNSAPKLRVFGEKETFGDAWVVPVPLRETVCGLPDALSVTDSVPVKLPEVVGLNVTFTVQFAPAATVEPQLFVSAKFAPALTPETVSVAVPELVSVTESGWLVVPTSSSPKLRVFGEKEATGVEGEVPVPDPVDPPPQPVRLKAPKTMKTR